MSDFPYFPLYPTDLLGDDKVIIQDLTEFGAYMRLLCLAWQQNPPASIPSDDAVIAKMLCVTPDVWARLRPAVIPCWQLRGNRLFNKRLNMVYQSMIERRQKYQKAGEKGAQHRYSIAIASLQPSGSGDGNGIRDGDGNAGTDADDLPPLTPEQRKEVNRLHAYTLERFGLTAMDINRERIRANLCELLQRGYRPEQVEEVVAWAKSPKAGKGTPQSAVSATDPLKFGQWLTTMENHRKFLEQEKARRNR